MARSLSWISRYSRIASSGSIEIAHRLSSISTSWKPTSTRRNTREVCSCEDTSQTIVRLPRAAAASPRAMATVDFPTPPLPVTMTSRLSNRSLNVGRSFQYRDRDEGNVRERANSREEMGFFNRHSKRIDPIPPPDDDSVTPDASWLAGDGDVAIPEGWHEPEPTAEPTPAPPQAETPEVETPEVEASEPVPVSENNPDPGPAAGERQLSSPNGNPAHGAESDRSSGEAGHGRIRASSDHRSPAA